MSESEGGGQAIRAQLGGFLSRDTRWGLEITPMGAGSGFTNKRCEEGDDAVVWHLAVGDEAETLLEHGGANPRETPGGNTYTEFSFAAKSTIYNTLESDDITGSKPDEGVLVGFHVCMSEHPESYRARGGSEEEIEENVYIMSSDWESDHSTYKFQGEYRKDDVAAYKIERSFSIGDDAPSLDEVLNPLRDIGISMDHSGRDASPDTSSDSGGSSTTDSQQSDSAGSQQSTETGSGPGGESGGGEEPTSSEERSPEADVSGGSTAIPRDERNQILSDISDTSTNSSTEGDSTVSVGYAEDVDVNIFKSESGENGIERVDINVDPGDVDAVRSEIEKKLSQISSGSESASTEKPSEGGGKGAQQDSGASTQSPGSGDGGSSTQESASDGSSQDSDLAEIAEDVFGDGSDGDGGGSPSSSDQSSSGSDGDLPPPDDVDAVYEYALENYTVDQSYNDFTSGCLSDYDVTVCAEVWQRLKEEGIAG